MRRTEHEALSQFFLVIQEGQWKYHFGTAIGGGSCRIFGTRLFVGVSLFRT